MSKQTDLATTYSNYKLGTTDPEYSRYHCWTHVITVMPAEQRKADDGHSLEMMGITLNGTDYWCNDCQLLATGTRYHTIGRLWNQWPIYNNIEKDQAAGGPF